MRATIATPLFDVTVHRSAREEHVLRLGDDEPEPAVREAEPADVCVDPAEILRATIYKSPLFGSGDVLFDVTVTRSVRAGEPDSPAAEILGLSAGLSFLGVNPLAVLKERLADESRAMSRRFNEKSQASARAAELRRHVRGETGSVKVSLAELARKYDTTPHALRKQIERAREIHPGDPFGFVIPKTKNTAPDPIFALLDEADRKATDGMVTVTPELAALWNDALSGFDRDADGMVTLTPEVRARLVAALAPYVARVAEKSETSVDVAETTPTITERRGPPP